MAATGTAQAVTRRRSFRLLLSALSAKKASEGQRGSVARWGRGFLGASRAALLWKAYLGNAEH